MIGRAAPFAVAIVLSASRVGAEDGSNEVCPADSVTADDVRERYDDEGRLVHQLRLSGGRVVQEIALHHRAEHAVARTEITPGHRRIARTYFDGHRVVAAECYEDGRRVGYARYTYDGEEHLVVVDKRLRIAEAWTRETTHHTYDASGELSMTEVRDGTGRLKSRLQAERRPRPVPIEFSLRAGGTYQSDTRLYDFVGGMGIHREPKVENYASDPLEVALDASYRFHRASGSTSADQTTTRLAVDYHDVLPRITLFTFVTTDRNLPVNLRLNLELAVIGAKLDIVPPRTVQLDVSFAPVWNFRSILAPAPGGATADETTSKLRGSLRARAGLHFETWSLLDTFEFLPTLYGDDVPPEGDFWHRSVVRNTVSFEVKLTEHFTFHEVFRYTWDPSMRAQADCPSSDPLCLGYVFSSTTALSLNLDL
ncbi:MAG TPA: hypothetical protein VFZ53_29575 [Polyangiaceae bacterium]